MFTKFLGAALLALALPTASLAQHHARSPLNRHNEIARRASGDVNLFKRFSGARWSFYDVEVGAGACGVWNKASSFTVALNSGQYGGGYPGPNCFKTITMQYNGKTAQATIMDECPGCPYGGLDLTRGLFSFFDSQDKGIIYGEWWFGGEESTPATSTAKKVTTTWKPETTTSQWVAPTTSTTKSSTITTWSSTVKSTSTSSTLSSSSSSLSSVAAFFSNTSSIVAPTSSTIDYSSGVAGGLAVPTGTVEKTKEQPQNINELNNLFIQLGGIIAAGARAQ